MTGFPKPVLPNITDEIPVVDDAEGSPMPGVLADVPG